MRRHTSESYARTHTARTASTCRGQRGGSEVWDAFVARARGRRASTPWKCCARGGLGALRRGSDEANVVTECWTSRRRSATRRAATRGRDHRAHTWRGHVAKRLADSSSRATPSPDGRGLRAAATRGARSAASPRASARAAPPRPLALIKYDYLKPGTEVKVFARRGALRGTLAELPWCAAAGTRTRSRSDEPRDETTARRAGLGRGRPDARARRSGLPHHPGAARTHAVTQDLVALMAQVIGDDVQEALVNTPHWAAYMTAAA